MAKTLIYAKLANIEQEEKEMATPVVLLGESQGRRSLVGCRLWGHTELDTTEET